MCCVIVPICIIQGLIIGTRGAVTCKTSLDIIGIYIAATAQRYVLVPHTEINDNDNDNIYTYTYNYIIYIYNEYSFISYLVVNVNPYPHICV